MGITPLVEEVAIAECGLEAGRGSFNDDKAHVLIAEEVGTVVVPEFNEGGGVRVVVVVDVWTSPCSREMGGVAVEEDSGGIVVMVAVLPEDNSVLPLDANDEACGGPTTRDPTGGRVAAARGSRTGTAR